MMSNSTLQRTVHLNGELVPESDARISIFDSAVMLGDAVTESTRTFHHVPFRLEDHVDRLFRSLKVARIDPGMTCDELCSATNQLVELNQSNRPADEDCWIVHNISRGDMRPGPSPRQTARATVMIFTAMLDLKGWARYYSEGCHAVTSVSRIIPAQALDARIKNRSRMNYTLCDAEARLVDPDAQCVILDTDGAVAENKGGNIFIVRDGMVLTPDSTNCLEGISRDTVLRLAQESGLAIRETRLLPYDLYTADEVFFTSTPYCIMPATRFNGLTVGDGAVGPVTRQLLKAWSQLVGVDIERQATSQLEST